MEAVARGVALGEDELAARGLVDVDGPVQDLVEQERQDDRVVGRAASVADLGLVGDVCRVGEIGVDPVPAGLEQDLCAHALVAGRPEHVWLLAHVGVGRVDAVEAHAVCYRLPLVVCQSVAIVGPEAGVPRDHFESWREGHDGVGVVRGCWRWWIC